MRTNEELLIEWTKHLRRRDCTPGTIYSFRNKVQLTMQRFGDRHLATLTSDELERFLDARNLGPKSRYLWISTLHRFYEWAVIHHPDTVPADPTVAMVRPKVRQGLPRPIPDADLEAAVAAAADPVRTWLVLGGWAGLRCMEIAGLHLEDVLVDSEMLLVRGKGGKDRLVPIHPRVADALPRSSRTGPMFRRENGLPYSPADVSRIINNHFSALEMPWTAHQLRHRFGTRVHDASGDILVTQALLGHASPTTTAVYAKFSSPRAVDAVRAVA